MTSMQVEYSKLIETQKHNRAMEAQAGAELEETKLHNRNTEQETASHNRATEAIQQDTNRLNEYLGELDSWTSITTTEMRNATELEKQKMVNDGQLALKNIDIAYQNVRDTLNRQLQRISTIADRDYKGAQKDKIYAEIGKIKRETVSIGKKMKVDRDLADASLAQAAAALQQAQTAQDNVERQKTMDSFEQRLKDTQRRVARNRDVRDWGSWVKDQLSDLWGYMNGEDAGTIID